MFICYIHVQIRNNRLIYQDKPRLKTALEMLRTSMYLEDSLGEVCNLISLYNLSMSNCISMRLSFYHHIFAGN